MKGLTRVVAVLAVLVCLTAVVYVAHYLLGVFSEARAVNEIRVAIGSREPEEPAEPTESSGAAYPEWTALCDGLIAHALGEIDGMKETNSREAMEGSYAAGHRVFELDLNLTTDGQLAVVHDWHSYNGVKSAEEWRNYPVSWKNYHSLMLEDVLAFMQSHTDMYIVTDTKSFEYEDEEMLLQFGLIYDQATESGVLDRVIIQIYNQDMYNEISGRYAFPNVIYTLYASKDTDAQVAEFVRRHGDIAAVTMAPVRVSEAFVEELTDAGKLVYCFTLNDEDEVAALREQGVSGFYTDFIKPG